MRSGEADPCIIVIVGRGCRNEAHPRWISYTGVVGGAFPAVVHNDLTGARSRSAIDVYLLVPFFGYPG